MARVNEDIDYLIQRLADDIRSSTTDPSSRLGLTVEAREAFDRHLGRVEHDAIIGIYKRDGYGAAVEATSKTRVRRALATEVDRDPGFWTRHGPGAKAHQPDPGTAVRLYPHRIGG